MQVHVPPVPPDSFPSDYDRNWDPTWNAPRDIIAVSFRPGTTVEQKGEAITAVSGRVVGGLRAKPPSPLEGMYLIRIPDEGTVEAALKAASKLREYAFVVGASLLEEWPLDTPG